MSDINVVPPGLSTSAIPNIGQYSSPVPASGKPVTIPTQVAAFAGPFRVVNLSNTATLWLADNPNVRDGNGMVLAPGTSLVWNGSQQTAELWAILGTDTASVTAGTATVLIGAPAQDVQPNPVAIALALLNSGLILVDNPVFLGSLSGAAGTLGPFDITKYQSIDISYQQGSSAASSILVSWLQNGVLIGQDSFGYAAGDLTILRTKLACRGNQVSVQTSLATSSINVYGSARVVSDYNRLSTTDRVIGTAQNAALGAGAGLTLTPLFRYDGLVSVTLGMVTAAAADTIDYQVGDLVTGRNVGGDYLTNNPASLVVNKTLRLAVPRNSWNITLTNRSAAARNCFLSAIADY